MFRQYLSKQLTDKKPVTLPEVLLHTVLIYAGWQVFTYLCDANANFLWGGWHWFKGVIGDSLGYLSYTLLSLSGYDMVHYKRVITIEGARGIYIADSYLGITPMVIFSGLVLLYGNNRKNKLWFIPLGIVTIFIINVFRVTTLTLIQYHYNSAFNPVHEYLYMAVTYGFVFLMVIWWLNKWADRKSTQVVQ